MQTDNPETPAGKLAEKRKPNPSKATPIGRDISDAKLRALKPAEKAYRQAVGGGLYLEVMPTGSKLWRWKYRLDGRENRFAIGKYPRVPWSRRARLWSKPESLSRKAAIRLCRKRSMVLKPHEADDIPWRTLPRSGFASRHGRT